MARDQQRRIGVVLLNILHGLADAALHRIVRLDVVKGIKEERVRKSERAIAHMLKSVFNTSKNPSWTEALPQLSLSQRQGLNVVEKRKVKKKRKTHKNQKIKIKNHSKPRSLDELEILDPVDDAGRNGAAAW